MIGRRTLYLAALAFAIGLSSTASAASQRVYVRAASVSAAQMDADLNDCIKQVLAYMNGPTSPAPPLPDPTPDQAIAHAFSMRGPKLAAAEEVRCMSGKGYVPLALTPDENKALSRQQGLPSRDRWYDGFVAGDLAARITAAQAGAAAASGG